MLSKYPLYGQGRTLPFLWLVEHNVDAINAIEDDEDVETRVMKHIPMSHALPDCPPSFNICWW